MGEPALTLWQPWADLVMADDGAGGCLKPVENRSWQPPKTFTSTPCTCLEQPPYSNVGDPDHDGSPDHCPDCGDTGWLPPRLWIHASKTLDGSNHAGQWDAWQDVMPANDPVLGALLGSVALTGCHHADECYQWCHELGVSDGWYCSRPWAEPDAYHWTLTDPRPLPEPIPMRGRQRLWTVEVPAHA